MTTHAISVINMDAWVYLFSKFSHEALLFEALALFLGLFGYAIFYLIRKRKYGVAGEDVPSNIVKLYLAQLVGDAEEMRNQLFGLLGKGDASGKFLAGIQLNMEVPASAGTGAGATAAGAPVATQVLADPKLAEKMRELEKKLTEQAGALDAVLNDKMKLEEELANARAAASAAPAAGEKGGASNAAGPMAERLKQLEAQLAEYAIIEDDLANLKRLQKENKSLKEQLASGAPAPVAPAPAAAAPAAAVAAPAPAPAVPEIPTLETPPAEAKSDSAPEKKAAPAPAPVMPDPTGPAGMDIATEVVADKPNDDENHPADFESLVDSVEKNLAEAAKSDTVDPNTGAAPAEFNLDGAPGAEPNQNEKSEEQLQADFEKMLNS